jgi:hypothetical protein
MTAPSPGDPLGYDAFFDDDLDAGGRTATGLELLANALPHRLMADTLPCIDAPDDTIPFGVNVRNWIGVATTQEDLDARIPLVDAALHLDPRVASTRVTMGLPPAPGGLVAFTIGLEVLTITGDVISRVLAVPSDPTAFVFFLGTGT